MNRGGHRLTGSGRSLSKAGEKAFKAKSFCHGDLSHKTIVIGDKGVYIKDLKTAAMMSG